MHVVRSALRGLRRTLRFAQSAFLSVSLVWLAIDAWRIHRETQRPCPMAGLVHDTSLVRAGELPIVARRTAALRVESGPVRLHVGDTLLMESVVLAAYDSAGGRIGTLRGFDSALEPRGHLRPLYCWDYEATSVGHSAFRLSYPKHYWQGRRDAPVAVALPVETVP
jgi:hypothetical protein